MKNLIFIIAEENGRYATINKLSIKNIKDLAHIICILDDAKKTLMSEWKRRRLSETISKKTAK